MFRPKKLSRTIIIGLKDQLETTIEILHKLDVVHIIDYAKGSDQTINIGKPTAKSSDASDKVLTLRSSAKLLELDEEKPAEEKMTIEQIAKDIDRKILSLEQEITKVTQEKTTLEDQLNSIDDQISQLIPFSSISIPCSRSNLFNSSSNDSFL